MKYYIAALSNAALTSVELTAAFRITVVLGFIY
jgi:hypothetical protein